MSDIDIFKVYEIQVDTFKYYLTHGRHLCIIYLAFIGGLLKFALDKNTTSALTYVNILAIILFCCWSERTRTDHLNAVEKLKESMIILTNELCISEHMSDCDNFINFVEKLKVINLIIGVAMIILFFLKLYGKF